MKRISIIALLLVCTFVATRAQNETHALRYSSHNPFGTARFAALGGAIGALGSDLAAVHVNPAGLAFYRSSEFSFSPSFYWVNTSSNFMGSSADDFRLGLNVGSLGYVAAKSSKKRSGFISANFAIGYNTLANFSNRTTMGTGSATSSLLDDFTWNANNDRFNPFYEDIATESNLVFYQDDQEQFMNDFQYNDTYAQRMDRLSEQSGYIGEYAFTGAFNISNFLYIGTTLGLHAVRFNEDIYHNESDAAGQIPEFREFQFREFNSTQGWGYTFRMGIILRPMQLIRVGASFQTPVFYRLTEEKYTDISSYWDSGSSYEDTHAYSPNGYYDYRLRTPLQVNAHASLILFKLATVSAAYEYLDYGTSRLDSYDSDKFMVENARINADYQAVHNLKAGAEVKLKIFYLRGGIQHLMSPYSLSVNNAEQWIWSAGTGIRTKRVFFDLSFARGNQSQVYGLYSLNADTNEVSLNDLYTSNLMATLGFKF